MSEKSELTKAQKSKIREWLKAHWKGAGECPVCQTAAWKLSDHMITPILYSGKNVTLGGAAYPMVMLICTTCGNTRFFNILIMGVLEEEEKEKKDETSEKREKADG